MTEKVHITLDNGTVEETAMHPVIVSASRATDIPAFYADWFFHRLQKGYSAWINPFNGMKGYVSYRDTRFIVFWSKNPRPLLNHLDELDRMGIGCYIQYTLNDYDGDNLERNVPPVAQRVDTFKRLVDRLGKGHVIWRFDPLVLTDRITIDRLTEKVARLGDQLKDYTEKLVFSFADIAAYRKVKANLRNSGINYTEWDTDSMHRMAQNLVKENSRWGLGLATCGETEDLPGVEHNSCVDHDLIIRLAHRDHALMDYMGVIKMAPDLFGNVPADALPLDDGTFAVRGTPAKKDKGQRAACGCMESKDIGQYNTCPHQCEYCYANASKELAVANWQCHQSAPLSDLIVPLPGQ